jgi:outer membrane biosynthesis protein TonB
VRRLWLAPALALVLAGCGSDDPRSQLRDEVADITSAANIGSPEGIREQVEELLATVRRQVTNRELSLEEGERIQTIALRIAQNADLVAPEPSPSPDPSPEPEPSPEPSPEPEPSEEPSPSPEPSQEPSPEPEPEPSEEEEPILEISPAATEPSPQPEPSPTAAQAQRASGPSPSPRPSS